ncbi:hypothetical protein [Synechococcus sp. 1G10]|uniref:hypothetical protein n=1 Tax=Synechococcus sp. 1G10 TaxID=2025605 RepID=UPI001303A1EE|nr:hypothetical protein [Synechococcus sp. 1G10]
MNPFLLDQGRDVKAAACSWCGGPQVSKLVAERFVLLSPDAPLNASKTPEHWIAEIREIAQNLASEAHRNQNGCRMDAALMNWWLPWPRASPSRTCRTHSTPD